MTLRECIINYREKHDLSQRQFASLCGLSNGYIAMIEANSNPKTGKPILPSLASIKKMAAGMGLSFQALADIVDQEDLPAIGEGDLSEDERILMNLYRGLDRDDQQLLISLAKAIK